MATYQYSSNQPRRSARSTPDARGRSTRNTLLTAGLATGLGLITLSGIKANEQAATIKGLEKPEPVVLQDLRTGKINPTSVRTLPVQQGENADAMAAQIAQPAAESEVSDIISHQEPGAVQPGDQITIPVSDLLPKYAPPK